MKRTKQQWVTLVAKQQDSGLSAAEPCRKQRERLITIDQFGRLRAGSDFVRNAPFCFKATP